MNAGEKRVRILNFTNSFKVIFVNKKALKLSNLETFVNSIFSKCFGFAGIIIYSQSVSIQIHKSIHKVKLSLQINIDLFFFLNKRITLILLSGVHIFKQRSRFYFLQIFWVCRLCRLFMMAVETNIEIFINKLL